MSTNGYEAPDPEDMFADTRMSFGDHIEELRTHLIRAVIGFVVGMVVSLWPLGPYVLRIIVNPLEDQLEAFHRRKVERDATESIAKMKAAGTSLPMRKTKIWFDKFELFQALGLPVAEEPVLDRTVNGFKGLLEDLNALELLDENSRKAGNFVEVHQFFPNREQELRQNLIDASLLQRKRVSAMNITEAFFVYFKISAMTGLVISSPWVFYQIWMFIAAGLYPHEKRLVNVYLPFSLFLFVSGALLCQFYVMPKAIEAMLWFNEWLGIDADLRLNEWLGFALMMPLVFGVSFQTPLVMMFMHKIGLVSVQNYRDYRRISWFVMAVFAAVITPSVDAVSMLLLWVPMGGLYELGILLCIYQGEQQSLMEWEEEEKSNELVEV